MASLCLNRLDTLTLEFLEQIDEYVDLGFNEYWSICERRGR